ncbi:MAG: aminoacyl-tRNA hydrolase [Planctomycetaceae bacterium]|nr:aminoacyl-tRNA hydrolase [Planctomycetaceae bacterium]
MVAGRKTVVGLGNPGAKYTGTRHNLGFEVLAELSRRHGGGRPAIQFDAEVVDIVIGDCRVLLQAPQTFMNLSGRSVRKMVDFYNLPLDDLLVVCDDLNLEPGRIRVRGGGSAGGQKGVADIAVHLGTQEFPRLRLGIGRPPGRMDAAAWVLSRFRPQDREEIDHAIVQAADAVEIWCRDGLLEAMNRCNGSSSGDQ